MPQALLAVTIVLTSSALAWGCANRALEQPMPDRQTTPRSRTTGAPPVSLPAPKLKPSVRPRPSPEPVMSIPPTNDEYEAPAPKPAPAKPTPSPSKVREGCRPLVA